MALVAVSVAFPVEAAAIVSPLREWFGRSEPPLRTVLGLALGFHTSADDAVRLIIERDVKQSISWATKGQLRATRRSPVSILVDRVFPPIDGTVSGEQERGMSTIADTSEPASEVERLIADLSASGQMVFVFGDGYTTAHLKGVTTPLFRGPADRRWWHVELGDEAASWTMDVRIDEITGVRFVRAPYPFRPHFPGHEVLGVDFLGPDGDQVLHCGVHDLYDGQRMRPEKLAAWRALRERYGDRDESRVDHGTLLAPAA